MTMLQMERAYYEDIFDILELYRECKLHDEINRLSGLIEEYPTYETAENDLDLEGLYVVREEGRIIGAVTLLPVSDARALPMDKIVDVANGCVLTRLCVRPDCQRRGIATSMIREASDRARKKGHMRICMLCPVGDIASLALCHKSGFCNQGISRLYGLDYILLERML